MLAKPSFQILLLTLQSFLYPTLLHAQFELHTILNTTPKPNYVSPTPNQLQTYFTYTHSFSDKTIQIDTQTAGSQLAHKNDIFHTQLNWISHQFHTHFNDNDVMVDWKQGYQQLQSSIQVQTPIITPTLQTNFTKSVSGKPLPTVLNYTIDILKNTPIQGGFFKDTTPESIKIDVLENNIFHALETPYWNKNNGYFFTITPLSQIQIYHRYTKTKLDSFKHMENTLSVDAKGNHQDWNLLINPIKKWQVGWNYTQLHHNNENRLYEDSNQQAIVRFKLTQKRNEWQITHIEEFPFTLGYSEQQSQFTDVQIKTESDNPILNLFPRKIFESDKITIEQKSIHAKKTLNTQWSIQGAYHWIKASGSAQEIDTKTIFSELKATHQFPFKTTQLLQLGATYQQAITPSISMILTLSQLIPIYTQNNPNKYIEEPDENSPDPNPSTESSSTSSGSSSAYGGLFSEIRFIFKL